MASMLNLRDALDEFGKSLGKRPISDNTRKAFYGDVSIFTRFVVPEERATLPAPAISTITAEHIRAFLAHEERRVNANSPKSLERRLTSLKVFFSWLRESGYLGFDPAEGIAYKPFQDPLPEYLSDAEQQRVIDAARHVAAGERLDTRPLTAIMLVLDTGMKKGECLKLTLDDVFLDDRSVLIRYEQKHLAFKNRRLPMSDDCAAALRQHIARYEVQGVLFDCTGRNLEYIFNRKVAPLAGLTSLTFEMLRWSCALRDYQLAEMTTVQFELKYGLSALGWAEMEAKLERIAKGRGDKK